jgi:hypothetical protein
MSNFEDSRGQFSQTHFTVIEIDLPVVEGECTISGEPGFGTPLSCDQPSNATKTYSFTTTSAPMLPVDNVFRCITNISETPAKLTGSLASRASGSITLVDFEGKDPNPEAPAVDDTVIAQGSFLSKLKARNVLQNKPLRIKDYRLETDGSIDYENGARIKHYIIDSLDYQGSSKWSLRFKDELSKLNLDEAVWPIPLLGTVRQDIDDTVTTIPVTTGLEYKPDDLIRSGDEFMKVISFNDTATPSIVVNTRGLPIVYTNQITRTQKEDHSAGDEIYICEVSDNERLDDLLERILLDVGFSQDLIPKSEWQAEIDEWHSLTRLNTAWYESEDVSNVVKKILTEYQLDMWFDPVERLVKLSAISVWKESTATLKEGNEIDYDSVKRTANENLRCTRALMVYDKRFLATSDSVENYKKSSLFRRTELETADLYGEPKTKNFDFSSYLDEDSANLLVNRWVNRNTNPVDYTWRTQERKLNFNTGDVVDFVLNDEVGFDGLPLGSSRGQITSIKTNYNKEGRDYTVTAQTYEPVFPSGSEIIITGEVYDVNLYIQYAGAPSQPVELTIVFDGVTGGSSGVSLPSIRAGAFPSGSKLIIILANGSELMAKGGDGGEGGGAFFDAELDKWFGLPPPANGQKGGTVFDAQGVDVDIYFSGATPSAIYPDADGYIIAPSGGDGGFSTNLTSLVGGNGGNGGNGRIAGLKGIGGTVINGQTGQDGIDGTDDRASGGFGQNGANNNAFGGDAGKGVVDSGGTVVFFGATPERYVNGGGDH